MCIMGTKRKVSPFMLILFSTLLLYSLTLIKRLKKQHQKQNYKTKQSIFPNFLRDFFPSYYEDTVTLYIITPTYPRPEQLPELTRLSQTLMLVKNVKWIVAEDANTPTFQVLQLLKRIQNQLPNVYLLAPMPEVYRKTKDPHHLPKGVSNRNKALEWILENSIENEAVIYFADDDNTYDIRLFTEIRKTQKVSMFPVGLVSGSPVSTPIVQDDQLLGFYLGWEGNRKFPLDMAGFAFTLSHYRKVCQYGMVSMPYIKGYEEDGFLKQLQVSRQSMEILTPDKILVWHTRTSKTEFKPFKTISREDYLRTNLGPLSQYWCLYMGSYSCQDR